MSSPEYSTIFQSLHPNTARNLSHNTISIPMMEGITPRWFLSFLPWVPVDAGVYHVNRVRKYQREGCQKPVEKTVELCCGCLGEKSIPQVFPDYEDRPHEYPLNLIQTVLRVNTNVTDVFNVPINQLNEQIRLTIEAIKERQEWELINNKEFGLLHSVSPDMKINTLKGSPSPDDMDELLSMVWKKPAFFLAHPRAIAAFGRECTRRGVPPATVNLCGSPFITWRGVPIIPTDKLPGGCEGMDSPGDGSTSILLLRVGEKEQGVVGLHQPGIPDEMNTPSLSVKFGGIDNMGISSYIMSNYFSQAVLTDDAVGMLQNVEVRNYHEY